MRRQLLQKLRAPRPPVRAFAVEAVEVFDVYQGAGVGEGKKSLAYALSFRSAERTLTDDEINVAFAKIQQDIVADGAVTVRA